jgi:hypothetical protein
MIFIVVVFIIIVAIIFFDLRSSAKNKIITTEIKRKYDKAIKDGNKALALELG